MTNFEWALNYLDVGWSIFPCKEKRPHFEALKKTGNIKVEEGKEKAEWESFQKERVSKEKIKRWFDFDPSAQIAVVCGRISGISVLDIDTGKKLLPEERKDTEDLWWEEFKKHPTLTAHTGGGGFHMFFKYSSEVPNSSKKFKPQYDTKNDGGYVILSPSIHHETKKAYEWNEWTEFSLDNLNVFPTEFLMTEEKENSKHSPKEWESIVGGVPEGSRNSNEATLVGKLLVRAYTSQEVKAAWKLIEAWNLQQIPPMSQDQLWNTFKSIYNKEQRRRSLFKR